MGTFEEDLAELRRNFVEVWRTMTEDLALPIMAWLIVALCCLTWVLMGGAR